MQTGNSRELYLRLLKSVKPYWKIFTGGIVAMVVLALSDPALAALMKPLLDGSFVEKNADYSSWIPLVLVGIFFFRGIGSYLSTIAFAWVASRVVYDLRQLMFARMLNLPTRYYDANTSGNVISKVIYDVTQVTNAATDVLTVLVRDSITVAGLLAWVIYLNWKLSLATLFIVPFIIVVVSIIARRLRHLNRSLQGTFGDMTHILEEAVQGHKVVKIFGGKDYEAKRFSHVSNWVRRYQIKIKSAGALGVPIVEFMGAIAMAFIIYIGVAQAAENLLTVGEFVSFFAALGLLFSPIKRLTRINDPLQRGLAAAESVFGLLDELVEDDKGGRELDRVKGHIRFSQVSFTYPESKQPVLTDLSFQINPQETIALVGPSGSGKTTLVSLIPRLYEHYSGNIFVDDINVQDFSLGNLRKFISYVSQDIVLFNDTVAANIAYGMDPPPNHSQIVAAALAAYAMDFIEQMPEGMNTLIGENGVRLSGGQRQRIAIARAILKDSPILILDEATSSLDSKSEKEVQGAIDNLLNDRTTLVIAHRLSTIEHADRILVLKEGRIVEAGTHSELLAKGAQYEQLYREQFRE